MMARRLEFKRLRWIAGECGLRAEELLDGLGDYLHYCKSRGDKGTRNRRGDFTDDELRDKIDEFKQFMGLNG
jgi:hypothetical protein